MNTIHQKYSYSIKIGWPIVFFTFLVMTGCKQNTDREEPETLTAKTTIGQVGTTMEEVERAVIKFNEAMVDPTVALMESLCSEQLTYGHSSGLVQDKATFIDDIVNGPFDFSSVEAPEQTIHISGSTAIVRHIFLAKATNSGEAVDIRLGNVQVYQKEDDGKLRLLARQAYKLPN